jgi:DNA-directed RNA polymerase subunit RPC12/RpoP
MAVLIVQGKQYVTIHPTKNETLTPRDVTPNSNKKVWWSCSKRHEWKAAIHNRHKGVGCPYCSGRLATKGKNIQVINPSLAKEWHPTKNGGFVARIMSGKLELMPEIEERAVLIVQGARDRNHI